ncbi:hypothetical protein [Eubacterium barkeri]|uniref:hypothetical protein n=1 Tax=Eubacterium barkeri TaxID=1528 RepID=UPI000B22EE13|nr:hypothetical protein [Eubacterium barkeri]
MIGFIRVLPVIGLSITLLQWLISTILLAAQGSLTTAGTLAGFHPANLIIQCLLFLLFTLGVFVHCRRLARAMGRGAAFGPQYTTVWFCPRFLFVLMASLYWFLRALFLHGRLPWQLFRAPRRPGDGDSAS